MELSGAQIRRLHLALLSAFPSRSRLGIFALTALEENLEAIAGGENLKEVAYSLITWAQTEGRLEELIEQAAEANPGNQDLQDFAVKIAELQRASEAKVQRYLRSFLSEIESRLEQMLSLTVYDTPASIETSAEILKYLTLPPSLPGKRYRTNEEKKASTFTDFSAAYAALGTRILLLGAPGAGKTTTLLQFACAAARARLLDSEQPIPICISIHRWDRMTSLSEWTYALLQEALSGVRLKGQDLLYLFDGLDELQGERLGDPQELQGEEDDPRWRFLRSVDAQLPDVRVVISCREQDFLQIGKKAPLQGAVTLMPLEPAQIEYFLVQRNQSALWAAIQGDASLLQLVRTPLLLTLLSLALGEERPEEALDTSQLTAKAIFDFYISRRFAHEAKFYVEQRFAHEAGKRALRFGEAQTRGFLGRVAASMWREWWNPVTELPYEDVEQLAGDQGAEYIEFVQAMHLMQAVSAQSLGFLHAKFRDYFALPVFLADLHADDAEVRGRAATTLGEIGDRVATSALIDALQDKSDEVRWNAVNSLGQIGDIAAMPALRKTLQDSDGSVRRYAAIALGRVGKAEAIPTLIETLQITDGYVGEGAADALGEVGAPSAVPALTELLRHTNARVRWNAVNALGKIGSAGTAPLIEALLDPEREVRWKAVQALVEAGEAAVPMLRAALGAANSHVRFGAAHALGKLGDAAGIPTLIEALKDRDGDGSGYALSALGEIGGLALAALNAALQDPDDYIRSEAAHLIEEILHDA